MKVAYLQQSVINASEGRLRLTVSPKRDSTLIAAVPFWLNSDSSRESALSILRWCCERYGYVFVDETMWQPATT